MCIYIPGSFLLVCVSAHVIITVVSVQLSVKHCSYSFILYLLGDLLSGDVHVHYITRTRGYVAVYRYNKLLAALFKVIQKAFTRPSPGNLHPRCVFCWGISVIKGCIFCALNINICAL